MNDIEEVHLRKSAVMHGNEYFLADTTKKWSYNLEEFSFLLHVDRCLKDACNLVSKLPTEMTLASCLPGWGDKKNPPKHRLLGMSGAAFRHFLNNLCNIENANYLEIGTFRGSSLICAAYQNTQVLNEIHAIDNFSEFIPDNDDLHPRIGLEKNLDLYLESEKEKINFYEEDCFSFDLSKLPKIQIYFYDGEHSRESQRKAFTYFEPVFADIFIAVVDDWEQTQVRLGTQDAFSELNYDVIGARAIIPPMRTDNINRVNNPDAFWWNGTYVAVLKKRKLYD